MVNTAALRWATTGGPNLVLSTDNQVEHWKRLWGHPNANGHVLHHFWGNNLRARIPLLPWLASYGLDDSSHMNSPLADESGQCLTKNGDGG